MKKIIKIIRKLFGRKPTNDGLVIQKTTGKSINLSNNRIIQRWRTAAGILLGLSMMSVVAFFFRIPWWDTEGVPAIAVYSWLIYPFIFLVSFTIFLFYIIWKKDKNLDENETAKQPK
jgi:hypothetical protein